LRVIKKIKKSAHDRLLDLILERVLLVEAAEEQRRQMEKVLQPFTLNLTPSTLHLKPHTLNPSP